MWGQPPKPALSEVEGVVQSSEGRVFLQPATSRSRTTLFSFTRMLQFRRIATQKRFIPQIDGLRFVAIASVVFFHIYAALEIGAIPVPSRLIPTLPNAESNSFTASATSSSESRSPPVTCCTLRR